MVKLVTYSPLGPTSYAAKAYKVLRKDKDQVPSEEGWKHAKTVNGLVTKGHLPSALQN